MYCISVCVSDNKKAGSQLIPQNVAYLYQIDANSALEYKMLLDLNLTCVAWTVARFDDIQMSDRLRHSEVEQNF